MFSVQIKLTWWFKVVHGVARIWRRRGLCRGWGEREKEEHEKKQARDLNFMISVVILQGEKGGLCLSAQPGEAVSE